MPKFKVGDKVRRVEYPCAVDSKIINVGDICVVSGVSDLGFINLKEFPDCSNYPFNEEWFELVERSGPVRTVTKKEIVPGTYGVLDVSVSRRKVTKAVTLSLAGLSGYVLVGKDQIQEMIETLSEIRDALEEE